MVLTFFFWGSRSLNNPQSLTTFCGEGRTLQCFAPQVKNSNCLTKNLLEKDSLPQIKNQLEMREISSAATVSGGEKDEVNDEREKAHREGHGLREQRHRIDGLERTLAWSDR